LTSMAGLLLLGLSFGVLGVLPPGLFGAALICTALTGLANPICNGPLCAVLQATFLPSMQGRVMSLIGALAAAISPLSLLVAGPVADALGIQAWYVVGGIVCFALGAAGFFIPSLANIEHDMKQQSPADEVEAMQPAVAVASK